MLPQELDPDAELISDKYVVLCVATNINLRIPTTTEDSDATICPDASPATWVPTRTKQLTFVKVTNASNS
jgi:hypothetical protein